MSDFHRYRNLSQEALGRARVISLEERRERGFTASEYRVMPAPTKGFGWYVAVAIRGAIDTHYRSSRRVLEEDLAAAGYTRMRHQPDYWERRVDTTSDPGGVREAAA